MYDAFRKDKLAKKKNNEVNIMNIFISIIKNYVK